jgi:hypothetical protein
VIAPGSEPRRFFLHANTADGRILAQDDRIGAPAAYWEIGDILLQRHTLQIPSNEESIIYALGLYDPETGRRLSINDGTDHLKLEIERLGE